MELKIRTGADFHALHEALAQYVENTRDVESELSKEEAERLSSAENYMHQLDAALAALAESR